MPALTIKEVQNRLFDIKSRLGSKFENGVNYPHGEIDLMAPNENIIIVRNIPHNPKDDSYQIVFENGKKPSEYMVYITNDGSKNLVPDKAAFAALMKSGLEEYVNGFEAGLEKIAKELEEAKSAIKPPV